MKHIGEMLGLKEPKKKARLSKMTSHSLMQWALEAHRLDKSKSVTDYYAMFIKRLRAHYVLTKQKEDFFINGIIET